MGARTSKYSVKSVKSTKMPKYKMPKYRRPKIKTHGIDYCFNHIDQLDDYQLIKLIENVTNKSMLNDIYYHVTNYRSVQLCQYLKVPCREAGRYQPSCKKVYLHCSTM